MAHHVKATTPIFTMRDAQRIRRVLIPPTPQARIERAAAPAKFNLRLFHTVLEQGAWEGHRCWIVAGGPSLKGMDLGFLRGELVIGINRAYEICDPTVLLCMDQRFWGWVVKGELGEESKQKFDAYQGIKVWSILNAEPPLIPPDEGYFLHSVPEKALSNNLEAGIHWGQHGGYAALNLAILLGASPIYLLGYDMNQTTDKKAKKVWWHDGYPNDGQKPTVYDTFVKEFEANKDALKRVKREIVNLNPTSGLKVFRRGALEAEKVKPVKRPLVVCFHTHPEYEKLANTMAASARRFGLEVEVGKVEDQGGWLKNVQYKAKYMLDKLVEKKRDVVWLDADSIVNSYPDAFDNFEGDIGVHYIDWKRHTGGHRNQRELAGAVVYLAYNKKVIEFLKVWVKAVALEPLRFEQLTLQYTIADYPESKKLKVVEFPAEYCTIFDTMADIQKPVIEQLQASRYLRGII